MTAAHPARRRGLRTVRSARNGLAGNRAWFDRTYQIRFIARVLLIIIAIAVASTGLTIALLWALFYRPGAGPQGSLIAALGGVAVMILIELLLAAPIVYVLGVRQSRQVVGPLRRITRTLGAIGSGDFSQRVVVRQDDILGMVASSINRMTERLQKRRGNSHQT
jgi:methyl-accepting chemotaxis protein